MKTSLRITALAVVLLCTGPAQAVNFCGGVWHQNTCGRPTNIYPCCPNGSNCTWWAWESMCRNWGIGPNNWGNANTWAGNARVDPRFELVGAVPGSVATSTSGRYGHVAWTIGAGGGGVTVTEQNCCSGCSGSVLTRSFAASRFNSGYVIRRGTLCSCSPGAVERKACGDCGTTARSCGGNCQWGGWSACAGPDPEGGNQVCVNGQQGVCADARRRCEGGNLACRQLVQPSNEKCDGLDNDCDGETDEGNPTEGASDRDYAATRIDNSFPRSVPAGSKATIWVEFTNSGKKTWERGDVWLAARGGSETVSAFTTDSWPSYDLAAGLMNPVAPGEVGRFAFEIAVPNTPGARIVEKFQLEGLGRTPIICPDGELSVSLLVLNADGSTPERAQEEDRQPEMMKLTSTGCSSSGEGVLVLAVLLVLLRTKARSQASQGVVTTVLVLTGCVGESEIVTANQPMTIHKVSPTTVTARGGEVLTITGSGFFKEDAEVQLGGRTLRAEFISEYELRVRTPPMYAGREPLVLAPKSEWKTELLGGLEVMPLTLRFVEAPPHSLTPRDGTVNSSGIADLDQDGDLDLVTCGARCEVLFNDGRSNFMSASADAGLAVDAGVMASDAGVAPRALPAGKLVALTDLDGDDDPDAVLVHEDVGSVYLNVAGRLDGTPALNFPALQAVTLGDLDGNGRKDLIVAAGRALTVRELQPTSSSLLLLGEEGDAGVKSLPIPAARALTLADVDGDGDDDVIVSTATAPNGIGLLLFTNTAGVLTEVPGGLPGTPVQVVMGLATGDVDHDGDVDLVAVGAGQDRLLLNDGSAHFFDATPALFPVDNSAGTSVSMVDLDRDRDLDIVVGNSAAAARLYVNEGNGRFADRTPLLPVATRTLCDVRTGDLDGDGDDDLLLVATVPTESRIYLSVEPRP